MNHLPVFFQHFHRVRFQVLCGESFPTGGCKIAGIAGTGAAAVGYSTTDGYNTTGTAGTGATDEAFSFTSERGSIRQVSWMLSPHPSLPRE